MLEFYWITIPFVVALVLSYRIIPVVIDTARRRNLFDVPNGRKAHEAPTPPLGGIAIVLGMLVAHWLWAGGLVLGTVRFIWVAILLMFLTGIQDDLTELMPGRKFLLQGIASCLVMAGGWRITTLHGFLGIYDIPIMLQVGLTLFFLLAVTNAYNLIDGIDGLAGGIGFVGALIFAFIFWYVGDNDFAGFSLALAGGLLGFLCFNFAPAKIFMGDTGSLSVGFTLAVFGVHFLQSNAGLAGVASLQGYAPNILLAILVVPVLDVSQVMVRRMLQGRSPFSPDREHTHHLLLELGYNHRKAALILHGMTLISIYAQIGCLMAGVPYLLAFSIHVVVALSCLFFLLLKTGRVFDSSMELDSL
ncbi:MAG: MraY family glycosyltransferase [Bacteroidota bacterium]